MVTAMVKRATLNESFEVTGNLCMVSSERLLRKPNFASIGGFEVKLQDGTELIFDWEETGAVTRWLPDGRLMIEWDLIRFDKEFYEASNPHAPLPDWEAIVQAQIDYIFYDVGIFTNGEEYPMKFDLKAWNLIVWSEKENFDDPFKLITFSTSAIEDYRKRIDKKDERENGHDKNS